MKWDLKSVITLILVVALTIVTLALIGAVLFGGFPSDNPLTNAIVLLFSNSATMVLTYYFTRKKDGEG